MGDDPKTADYGPGPVRLPELLEQYPELQEQIENIVIRRLARDRKTRGEVESRMTTLEQELATARERQQAAEASLSELDGLRQENARLAADVGSWKNRYAKTLATRQIAERLDAANVVRGARDLLVDFLLSRAQPVTGENDEVSFQIDGQPLADAVTALLAERPDILNAPAGGGTGSGGSPLSGSQTANSPVSYAQVALAKRQGKLAECMADPGFARQAHQALLEHLGAGRNSPLAKQKEQ